MNANNANPNSTRVNIAIEQPTHEKMAKVAKLLGQSLKDATEEALSEWIQKNTPMARKRAKELLAA